MDDPEVQYYVSGRRVASRGTVVDRRADLCAASACCLTAVDFGTCGLVRGFGLLPNRRRLCDAVDSYDMWHEHGARRVRGRYETGGDRSLGAARCVRVARRPRHEMWHEHGARRVRGRYETGDTGRSTSTATVLVQPRSVEAASGARYGTCSFGMATPNRDMGHEQSQRGTTPAMTH